MFGINRLHSGEMPRFGAKQPSLGSFVQLLCNHDYNGFRDGFLSPLLASSLGHELAGSPSVNSCDVELSFPHMTINSIPAVQIQAAPFPEPARPTVTSLTSEESFGKRTMALRELW